MNWRLKSLVLRSVARLPLGTVLYSRFLRRNRDPLLFLPGQLKLLTLARQAGFNPHGAACLEVGTGWEPTLPYALYLTGAASVLTVDINPWLRPKVALRCWQAIGSRLGDVATAAGLTHAEVEKRYQSVDGTDMTRLFSCCGIVYRCPADAAATGLPGNSLDAVLSASVLEHVPPAILAGIHRESRRILRPGGWSLHLVNPEDHFSQSDSTLSSVDFLRYDRATWEKIAGPFAYHNRLRAVQHRKVLEAAGLMVAWEQVEVDRVAVEALRTGTIVPDAEFASLTPEELTAIWHWLFGRKV
jgi:hypothetical protein